MYLKSNSYYYNKKEMIVRLVQNGTEKAFLLAVEKASLVQLFCIYLKSDVQAFTMMS